DTLVQAAFQPGTFNRVGEDDTAQYLAVERAIGTQDDAAEVLHYGVEGLGTRLQQGATDDIGINHFSAECGEEVADSCLAAADAAREANHEGFVALLRHCAHPKTWKKVSVTVSPHSRLIN